MTENNPQPSYQAPYAAPRRLVAWRVGTHALGVVTRIVGYDPSLVSLVSSYARVWDR